MWNFPLFPDRASSFAGDVDAIYLALVAVSLALTIIIAFLILFFGIRYRRTAAVDRSNAPSHSTKVELLWVIIPLPLLLGLFAWGSVVYFDQYNVPGDAAEIYVVGKQWMWYLQHPEGKREINELHLPVGRPVKLVMTSQDVIHDFYVPAFRTKQDVLPGVYTSMWFRPTRTGRYHLFCAEYCGTNHSTMGGWVVVMEPGEYEAWLQEGEGTETMTAAGERLFRQYHCSGCHGGNGSIQCPPLENVYGHPVPIQQGEDVGFVTADEAYIRDSILLPMSQVVAGYDPVMPSYQGQINERDLLQIIAYIKSLSRKEGAAR